MSARLACLLSKHLWSSKQPVRLELFNAARSQACHLDLIDHRFLSRFDTFSVECYVYILHTLVQTELAVHVMIKLDLKSSKLLTLCWTLNNNTSIHSRLLLLW